MTDPPPMRTGRPPDLGAGPSDARLQMLQHLEGVRALMDADQYGALRLAHQVHQQATAGGGDLATGWALLGIADCEVRLALVASMRTHAETALTIFRRHGERHGEAQILNNLTFGLLMDGRAGEAFAQMVEVRAMFADLGDLERQLVCSGNLSMAAGDMGDRVLSVRLLIEALEQLRASGAQLPKVQARLTNNLAAEYLDLGSPEEARVLAHEALELAVRHGMRSVEGSATVNLADAMRQLGDGGGATALLTAGLHRFNDYGDQRLVGQVWTALGDAQMQQGDARPALRSYLKGLRTVRAYGDQAYVAKTKLLCGQAWAALGQTVRPLRLFAAARDLARTHGYGRTEADAELALSQLHHAAGQHQQALAHFRAYDRLDRALYHTAQDLQMQAQKALHQSSRAEAERDHQRAQQAELEALHAELERQASTDALTGIFNRRTFEGLLDAGVALDARHPNGLGVLLIDIDHFKGVNDTYGHAVGDAVLREVAALLTANLRADEAVGRWGGEEFIVLLHADSPAGAWQAGERFRAAVQARGWSDLAPDLTLTISAGVALRQADEPLAALLNRADQALYAAKDAGRNQVRSAHALLEPEKSP